MLWGASIIAQTPIQKLDNQDLNILSIKKYVDKLQTGLVNVPKNWCGINNRYCKENFIADFQITIDDEGLYSLYNNGRLVCVHVWKWENKLEHGKIDRIDHTELSLIPPGKNWGKKLCKHRIMNIYEYQYPEPGQPAIDPNIAPKKPEETWGPNHPYDDPECGWKCMG